MKRIVTLILIATMSVATLAGCGGETKMVTLPAEYFAGQDLDSVAQGMIDDGAEDATVNEDGSITVEMSKEEHDKIMTEMKDNLEESLNGMIADGELESIKEIDCNEDFTAIDITVDRAKYENSFDGFAIFGMAIGAGYYQIFDGVSSDDVKIDFNLVDTNTGEKFDTVVFPDDLENTADVEES